MVPHGGAVGFLGGSDVGAVGFLGGLGEELVEISRKLLDPTAHGFADGVLHGKAESAVARGHRVARQAFAWFRWPISRRDIPLRSAADRY